jgi:hypothetical protein
MSMGKTARALPQTAFEAPLQMRVDLRTGVRAGAFAETASGPMENWIASLRAARLAWLGAGNSQPLSAAAPDYLFEHGEAARLDALLRGAGFTMRSATIEIEERELAACETLGMAAVERLRARGWGVALRCDKACPLALGSRGRSLFTEVLAAAPNDLSPAAALAEPSSGALLTRLRAAQAFGLPTTALGVKSPAHAGLLTALGFDRGEYC